MSEQAVTVEQQGTQVQQQETYQVVSVMSWLLYLIVMSIPLVNIVMLFVWAFGSGVNKNKSNLAKASLILAVVFTILAIVFSIMVSSLIGGLFGDFIV
ncbi:MAG: hypothetical protein LRY73_02035 [Bacillus sp. (in: Bacteria)]|nr:hypothetical protein [Bacillus sp. (in: firmicutes)]